jgi:hypothetical protein
MKLHALTLDRVNHLLAYSPTTGIFTWKVQQGKARTGSEAGTIQHGYRKVTIDKEQIKLHRLAWFVTYGAWPTGQIDHINGDKADNRIANLRDVPMSVNMQNRYATRRKENNLPYGVVAKDGKFVANIRVGTYNTAEEASEAYMAAKRLIHEGCTR